MDLLGLCSEYGEIRNPPGFFRGVLNTIYTDFYRFTRPDAFGPSARVDTFMKYLGAAVGSIGAGPRGWLLGRGGGLLNTNDYIRLGWSWKGSAMEGKEIIRLAIGSKRLPIHWHFP